MGLDSRVPLNVTNASVRKKKTFQEDVFARAAYFLPAAPDGDDSFEAAAEDAAAAPAGLEIEVLWGDPKQLLEPPGDIDAVVYLYFAIPDAARSVLPQTPELRTLESFAGGLENKGVTWVGLAEGEEPLEAQLFDVLETVRQMGPRRNNRHEQTAVGERERSIWLLHCCTRFCLLTQKRVCRRRR